MLKAFFFSCFFALYGNMIGFKRKFAFREFGQKNRFDFGDAEYACISNINQLLRCYSLAHIDILFLRHMVLQDNNALLLICFICPNSYPLIFW